MKDITGLMANHHKRCDDHFAAAEGGALNRSWDSAKSEYEQFCHQLEAHFEIEEELLFPNFERNTGSASGPTEVMRYEHAQMRGLVGQMSAALAESDADAFTGLGETLLVLMQQHNLKEENILYPMFDRTLGGEIPGLLERIAQRLGAQ